MYSFRYCYKQLYNNFSSNRKFTFNNNNSSSNNSNIMNEYSKCKTKLHMLLNNYKNNELTLWVPIEKYNINISDIKSKIILHEISFIHATCSSPKMLNDVRKYLIKERLLSLYSYADCSEKETIIKLLNYYKLL